MPDHPSATMPGWQTATAYRRAYSRAVGFFKFVLPTVAVMLILLVILWPYISPKETSFKMGFTALDVIGADDPSMINPRYFGVDSLGRGFSVSADIAHNLTPNGKQLELDLPKADITLSDGSWLALTASSGHYDRETEKLYLEGNVNLFHDSGYEFHAQAADIDLKAAIASSRQPVLGQGPFGDMKAEGIIIRNQENIINLQGRSRIVLMPGGGAVQ